MCMKSRHSNRMTSFENVVSIWKSYMKYKLSKDLVQGMRNTEMKMSVFMMLTHDRVSADNPLHAMVHGDIFSLVYTELKHLVTREIFSLYDVIPMDILSGHVRAGPSITVLNITWSDIEECTC